MTETLLASIEDILAEFGENPAECLAILGEHIGLIRHHGILSGWIPVETPPNESGLYIVAQSVEANYGVLTMFWSATRQEWLWQEASSRPLTKYYPTHWTDLLTPPTGESL